MEQPITLGWLKSLWFRQQEQQQENNVVGYYYWTISFDCVRQESRSMSFSSVYFLFMGFSGFSCVVHFFACDDNYRKRRQNKNKHILDARMRKCVVKPPDRTADTNDFIIGITSICCCSEQRTLTKTSYNFIVLFRQSLVSWTRARSSPIGEFYLTYFYVNWIICVHCTYTQSQRQQKSIQ